MKKTCTSCGKELIGRTDKKFCNEGCKNQFHNMKSRSKYYLPASRNGITNRQILKHLTREGVREIAPDELITNGFDFKDITGIEFLKKGALKLFCHEFALVKMGSGFVIHSRDQR